MKSFMTYYICFVTLYWKVRLKYRSFTPSAPFYINTSLLFYMIERVQSFKIYSGFVLKLYLIIGFFVQTFKNFYDIGNVVKLSLRSYICTSTVLSHTIDQVYNYRKWRHTNMKPQFLPYS